MQRVRVCKMHKDNRNFSLFLAVEYSNYSSSTWLRAGQLGGWFPASQCRFDQ
jgi:hypothetical protein